MPEDTARFEEVRYSSGEVVRIKRVRPSQIDDLIELQKTLLSAFIYHSAMLGELLRPSNEAVWADIRRMAGMLRLVGPEDQFLDADKIDDFDELCRVFFTATSTIDPDTGGVMPEEETQYEPSIIAKLHSLNFWSSLREGRQMAIARLQTENQLRKAEQEIQTVTPSSTDQEPVSVP